MVMALRTTLNASARQLVARRSLSTVSAVRAPHSGPNANKDAFDKREKAAEDMYVRDQEKEKLKALQKSIEASKAHLSKLEQDAKALESSINSDRKQ
ncbi:hypothetical protein ACM66B_006802 [Microbotryomycetes sp. NB124-2]